ncbi:CELL WALL / VACUOLAR INHIBITOR OF FRUCTOSIDASE 2, cell wall / vacuolar inhibitor of fructosidase 2 [Hibiscus trionum]|uniref:CELL WALL / VACUOLAR INHIBITOR OF FRUCTOSIDASE 2, cell wall / vacuolar inhibitor of fructosidase 2 n=1 Tax=Hibiscus trionum TaxID=183268 RepID=A0A9W7IP23_HIBTR|nr:CELL WALL / VACUOLAR INHIBITOR OF FRUCTOSIDASE 2, cell wall / vacuolar inhibitor of fructosidase 2 [Hibiscus trionum]
MGSSFLIFNTIMSLTLALVNGDAGLIQKTCKSTKYYDLCVSSLESDPSSSNSDTKGLAMIMVGVGMANATATSTFLSSQLFSTTNDTVMNKVLRECSDKYGHAADALQASVQDFVSELYDYVYMHVMAAADYPNACRNTFRRYPGLVYPQEIARRGDGLKHICDVVLGIVDHLAS